MVDDGRQLVAHAFDQPKAQRILARTDHDNVKSIALLHRLGMRTVYYSDLKLPGVIEVFENPAL